MYSCIWAYDVALMQCLKIPFTRTLNRNNFVQQWFKWFGLISKQLWNIMQLWKRWFKNGLLYLFLMNNHGQIKDFNWQFSTWYASHEQLIEKLKLSVFIWPFHRMDPSRTGLRWTLRPMRSNSSGRVKTYVLLTTP